MTTNKDWQCHYLADAIQIVCVLKRLGYSPLFYSDTSASAVFHLEHAILRSVNLAKPSKRFKLYDGSHDFSDWQARNLK